MTFTTGSIFDPSNWILVSSNTFAWTPNTAYIAGDVVSFNNRLYIAIAAFTSGTTFDPTNWTLVGADSVSDWAANTNYLQNEVVVENSRLYRANADFTSGTTFVLANWTEISPHQGFLINDWTANTVYTTNNVVLESNRLYKANADFTSGVTFVESNWTEISPTIIPRINILDWAATTDYLINDMVIESNLLYRANATFTSGAVFDVTNWTEISPAAIINSRGASFIDASDYLTNDTVISRVNDSIYRANVDVPNGTGDPSTNPIFTSTFTSNGNSTAVPGGIILGRTTVGLRDSIGLAGDTTVQVLGVNYPLVTPLTGPTNTLTVTVPFEAAVIVTDQFDVGFLTDCSLLE